MRTLAHCLALLPALVGFLWPSPARAGDATNAPALPTATARDRWEELFRERLRWWSLQPLAPPAVPPLTNASWPRNDVDRFVLAALRDRNLEPAPEAAPRLLARRLAFALTGLPPAPELVDRFAADPSPGAYDRLVAELLASPHFGEHWTRHWLDVVHYADTHGYEWDTPAKNAWRYRDYLVRAFNADVPFDRLVLEQLAGDLLEPRVDPASGMNEAMIGPMALRLGERRHGDNAAAEGVTQEAIANLIDTVGKGFLATTIACAQCHDHKLDAVEQRDFYGLAGVFMSTRWIVRCVDATDPNPPVIAELRRIKTELRQDLARTWLASRADLVARIRDLPQPAPPTNATASTKPDTAASFPSTLKDFWIRSRTTAVSAEEFTRERARRQAENRTNLVLLADFTRGDTAPAGWQWDGFGMHHGLVRDGEPVIADDGDFALQHLLPAGRWSHVWSMRLAGALRSPLLATRPAWTFSAELAGGRHAAEAFIVDQAFHSERMQFLDRPYPGWRTLKAGDFDTLEGGLDQAERRVYLEWATKSLNNYFPPRTGYGGLKESDLADERSWFGVTRLYRHAPGHPPLDELGRFAPLFDRDGDWAERLADLVRAAVDRWGRDTADAEDVRLLNDALAARLLANDLPAGSERNRLVQIYRALALRLEADRTVGSAAEWSEAKNERIGIRGSYTTFGAEVPRGNIRFLGGPTPPASEAASGRLEFARSVADGRNPLTARVFVNRVWLWLFGAGLVRTPDDFGHLGEKPSHPELLDHLASTFVADGWSLKRLITRLVTSATWRQDSRPAAPALEVDPENRLWHHLPLRRLEAESIRDTILAVSGRLDPALYGPPVDPYRVAEDPAKRLFRGPLDGAGRRSLYTKMTLMEPPRFLALFNQPIPKLTTGRRDVTSVPDQALALLNDPFVIDVARHWGTRVVSDGSRTPEERVTTMFRTAFARAPEADETARLVSFARRAAPSTESDLMTSIPVWQDVAHALFNLKEFIHVR